MTKKKGKIYRLTIISDNTRNIMIKLNKTPLALFRIEAYNSFCASEEKTPSHR